MGTGTSQMVTENPVRFAVRRCLSGKQVQLTALHWPVL